MLPTSRKRYHVELLEEEDDDSGMDVSGGVANTRNGMMLHTDIETGSAVRRRRPATTTTEDFSLLRPAIAAEHNDADGDDILHTDAAPPLLYQKCFGLMSPDSCSVCGIRFWNNGSLPPDSQTVLGSGIVPGARHSDTRT